MTLGSNQAISSLWNGVNSAATGAVTVRNAAYNGTLAAGASTTFGFTTNGSNTAAPTGFSCSSPARSYPPAAVAGAVTCPGRSTAPGGGRSADLEHAQPGRPRQRGRR